MSESKGLGDSIEKIAKQTKIKNLVEVYNKYRGKKKGCGCAKRKDKLNKAFSYKNLKK